MSRSAMGRYAIYYAPEKRSPLHEFGSKWLGRDAITEEGIPRYSVPGFTDERLLAVTEAPRHYGLHATLKPPFYLADGIPPQELVVAVRSLASKTPSFSLPSLTLKWIGKFLALVPSEPCEQLSRLAADCVRRLDNFRAPACGEELDKRRANGLSFRQEKLLQEWGYPYVMDEFRFHISLTSPMEDREERQRIFWGLENLTATCRRLPLDISSICIFQQESREAPFHLVQRFRFSERAT